MNILSILSFTNFILFVIGALYIVEHIHKSRLALPLMLALISLAIWCLGDTFLYIAPDKNIALFWYRFTSIGWVTFPAFALHFFVLLTKSANKLKYRRAIVLIYIIPVLLLIENNFNGDSLLLIDIVQSSSGLGWTIVNSINNLGVWLYTSYLAIYIICGLILVHKWGKLSSYFSEKQKSLFLIIACSIALCLGIYTDIISPIIDNFFPPIANITVIILFLSGIIIVNRYNLLYDANTVTAETILKNIKDPLIIFDVNFNIIKINQATTDLLGYKIEDIKNKELVYILANHKFNHQRAKILCENKVLRNMETNLLTADSKIVNAIYSASVIENKHGEFLGYILTFRDITNIKAIEFQLKNSNYKYKKLVSELYKAANYDLLTGLPNRRIFFSKLDNLIDIYNSSKKDFAVIYMDLNGFKKINDTYGHNIGDYVLVDATNRLKKCTKRNEILSRIGGDEFVIIIPNSSSKEVIDNRVNLIKRTFLKKIKLGKNVLDIGISIGYSIFSESDENIDILVKNADTAMYNDKIKNKNNRG